MRIITVNGRLANDVVRQVSKQGTEFINFSIANNEYGDPKSSDGQPQTQWFRVTSFQPTHVNLAQHLKKGKPITVIGRYSNRLYQNQTTGQWNISNDIIASDIYFEIGSERQDGANANRTTSTSSTQVAEKITKDVESIPQVTSNRMKPNTTVNAATPTIEDDPFAAKVDDNDDELPF